jgi:hypothetical protein
VQRVDPAEGFHGQVEDQLEVRRPAGEGLSFEGCYEAISRGEGRIGGGRHGRGLF